MGPVSGDISDGLGLLQGILPSLLVSLSPGRVPPGQSPVLGWPRPQDVTERAGAS